MAYGGTSLSEFVIFWYVSKSFPDACYRKRIDGVELDIYVPSIHTAVEFDGKYWHLGKIDSESRHVEYRFVAEIVVNESVDSGAITPVVHVGKDVA